MRGHTPFGYKIVNGKPEICEESAEMVRTMFNSFLSGRSYVNAAKDAGLCMLHTSSKNILRNPVYMGKGHYPRIVSDDLFYKVKAEIAARENTVGDRNVRIYNPPVPATKFVFQRETEQPSNPFMKAEYIYGLIESEVERDAGRKERNCNTSK